MRFDPDALLAAMPKREINLAVPVRFRASTILPPERSALGETKQYNGFSIVERNRTARLSNRLAQLGATVRPAICDICGGAADDEHAENYYDLSRWVGLCKSCHQSALHNRFGRPHVWANLLDRSELPHGHWARLVSPEPFDLAQLLRSRGVREPTMAVFLGTSG